MEHYLERTFDLGLLDKQPFLARHRLVGHEALSLENLSRVVRDLPGDQVFYSSGKVDKVANFDRAHLDNRNGLSLAETMQKIRTSDSYVMVRKPESHPSFRGLFEDVVREIEGMIGEARLGTQAIDPMFYLFIASPNSITPYHIDRYSTFLFQFQGSKSLFVYPPWNEELVPQQVAESFVARSGARPMYDAKFDHLAQEFRFEPGQTLHIPFLAPHHVKNGPDDVSVSLSIIFNTRVTQRQLGAMRFNDKVRRSLDMRLAPAGTSAVMDGAKAFLLGSAERLVGGSRGLLSRPREVQGRASYPAPAAR
jgi:Cupin-like domain